MWVIKLFSSQVFSTQTSWVVTKFWRNHHHWRRSIQVNCMVKYSVWLWIVFTNRWIYVLVYRLYMPHDMASYASLNKASAHWRRRRRSTMDSQTLINSIVRWEHNSMGRGILSGPNMILILVYIVTVIGFSIDIHAPWAIKTCHFVFDYNSGFSWSIFILFTPVERGRNTLHRS